jgi:medium-chain acyl-[acyl-carrier-protein] hydrolase
MVEAIADAIQPELEVPFAFFGHSLGAAVAFEVARELRRRGTRQPRRLVVSARPMPRAAVATPPIYDLPPLEFGEAVQRRYGVALPPVSDPRLLKMVLLTMRADIEMHETYQYRERPPLTCPLSAWAGARDPLAPPPEMAGWRNETTGPFELRIFSGGHFYQRTEERQVLQGLGALLEEAMAPEN